jgi:hypothetical protein
MTLASFLDGEKLGFEPRTGKRSYPAEVIRLTSDYAAIM